MGAGFGLLASRLGGPCWYHVLFLTGKQGTLNILGDTSTFFSGNHQKPRGNSRFLKGTMVEKNGESTPKILLKKIPEEMSRYPVFWSRYPFFCVCSRYPFLFVALQENQKGQPRCYIRAFVTACGGHGEGVDFGVGLLLGPPARCPFFPFFFGGRVPLPNFWTLGL